MSTLMAHPSPCLDKHAPPEFARRVRRGMKRGDLAKLDLAVSGKVLGETIDGAEIGVADGRFSRVLCDSIPNLRLLCVDPYLRYEGNTRGGQQEQHDGNWDKAHDRLHGFNVLFMRQKSIDAAASVPAGALDFVYIDGNHDFDFVIQDLIHWSARVRSGGIVAGHGFYHFPRRRAGVVEAVVAYTAAHDIDEWWLTDEREPSFWWVKP
jgi:hypothetical protein